MSQDVRITFRDDKILEIALGRTEKGNILTADMAVVISAALKSLPADARAVLMKTEGPDFCTGRSAVMPPAGTRATALDLRALVADPVLDFYADLRSVKVPLVAAVRGRAAGVGCALAGLADLCIAADSAIFSVPEMNLDIAPTLVMTALADRITRGALARLVFTRDPVSAREAQELGIVALVVPEAALDAEVERILAKLSNNSAATVQGVKAFLNSAPEMSFAARREHAALVNCVVTAERYR